jgi:hypothetical protein
VRGGALVWVNKARSHNNDYKLNSHFTIVYNSVEKNGKANKYKEVITILL